MKLSEGLLVHTKLDEEDVIFMEKVIEGFCHYLPICKEISFLIPEKNGEGIIVICNICFSKSRGVEINEGEFLEYKEYPEIKATLENNKGIYLKESSEKTIMYIPISKNRKTPIGLVKIYYTDSVFAKDEFLNNIKDMDFMDEIYNKCFSKFIADPYIYLSKDGEIESVNYITELFKQRIKAYDSDWFFKLWKSRESRLSISEIINDKICTGIDFEINGFEFFIILYPLFIKNEYQGMIICFDDVTIVKSMLKKVIGKSTVIKEVHHRVKNNLQTIASLLSLQARRANSLIVEKALSDSINRISSIALVYEALTKDGANVVNVGDCIKNILSMILNNMVEPNQSIKGEIRGKEIYLNSSQASNVSLCVTELLQNAVKHAFVLRKNGNIVVSLNQVNQEVIITIEDDGVGLQGKKVKSSSLGLQIIQMITRETLKGSFKLESHTYGTIAEIRFHI